MLSRSVLLWGYAGILICAFCAVATFGQTGDDHYNRGIAAYNAGNYDLSITEYTTAIRFNPNDSEAYYGRALSYLKKLNYDQAIADNSMAIRINPNYADAYYNRANAYYEKQDWEHAKLDYQKALTLEPNKADAKQGLANAQEMLNQASPPQPSLVPNCPTIDLHIPAKAVGGEVVDLSADVSGGDASARPYYYWSITGGRLTEKGLTAKLDTFTSAPSTITVILEANGFDRRCKPGPTGILTMGFIEITKPAVLPKRLIEQFQGSVGESEAEIFTRRLAELKSLPAHIEMRVVVRPTRSDGGKDADAILARLKELQSASGIDADRVKMSIGEKTEASALVEIWQAWIVPPPKKVEKEVEL